MGRRVIAGAAGALALLALTAAAPASAAFRTGFASDAEYLSADASVRDEWFDKTVQAEAGLVRLNVYWRQVAPSQPIDPGNPADPTYDFSAIDRAVADASERGLDVMLTIFSAPKWAEGPDRPADAPAGSWKPDPAAFAAFGRALATRYSGGFAGLPRVRYFQAWNEPNIDSYLLPQYEGKTLVAPQRYRELLNAFNDAVKAVNAGNVVITGGLSPYGDPPGQVRTHTRPLEFFRELLCVRENLSGASCPVKPRFDVLAHNPINTSGGPRRSALHPDDVSTPDFKNVGEVLRAAERANRVPGGRHALWATEIWWETNPPQPGSIGVRKQARWLSEALYVLWKQGADVVINLPLRDVPFEQEPFATYTLQSGVFFADGSPKPSFEAFRFPFVSERKSKRRVLAWGKAPAGGKLRIQRKAGSGWSTVKSLTVGDGKVFTVDLQLPGKAKLRAVVGSETSPAWKQTG